MVRGESSGIEEGRAEDTCLKWVACPPEVSREGQFMKHLRVVHLCPLPLWREHPDHGRLTFHPGRWVLNLALAQKAHSGVDPVLVTQFPGESEKW